MKAIAVITIPDDLADRWQRDVGATGHDDLAVIHLDEAITDAIAARLADADSGNRYESVRKLIGVRVLPNGEE